MADTAKLLELLPEAKGCLQVGPQHPGWPVPGAGSQSILGAMGHCHGLGTDLPGFIG